MAVTFVQKLIELLKNIKRSFGICIAQCTPCRWTDHAQMLELAMTCMHPADHLTAAGAIVKAAIEHGDQMPKSIKVLVITVVTPSTG